MKETPERLGPLEPLATLIRFLVGGLFAVLVVVVFTQVLLRYVFQSPWIWAEDVTTFSFIWLAFLGTSLGVRGRIHFGFDMALRLLPPGGQRTLSLLVNFLILIFSVFVVKEGWTFTVVSKGMLSYASGLPMNWMYAAVPAGGVLCLIFALEDSVRLLRKTRRLE